MTIVLCFIFFVSGVSALVFEALWFQLSGLALGNSVWASSIVLSSFMGGLALGNAFAAFRGDRIASPVRFYALLEIIIGVSGLTLVFVFPGLTVFLAPLFRHFLDYPLILNFLRGVIAFVLMLAPATAMGATLPILVKALCANKSNFGQALGILYGWNTLGAVVGVLLHELLFLGWLGIRGTGMVAAGCNLFAAVAAMALVATTAPVTSCDPPGKFSKKIARLLAASFLAGFTLLALEVIWFRFMILFFNAYSRNFAVMLAVVLAGIALGGLFASIWFKRRPDAHRFLVHALLCNGILVVVLYGVFDAMLKQCLNAQKHGNIFLLSSFLMLPVSFVSGLVFTMIGKALNDVVKAKTGAVGLLTLANTLGAMFGSLAAGFFFIRYLGIEKSFFLMALVYGMTACLVFDKERFLISRKSMIFQSAAALTFTCVLFFFPFGAMNRFLDYPCLFYFQKGEKRVAMREGLTETVQYLRRDILKTPLYYRLITNDHSMSATSLWCKRYMKLFVYWPVAVHPAPKNALLICYGCGSTAKALTDTGELEHIDIVDISRDVIDLSEVIYPKANDNPTLDPRVKIHIEDGRFFMLTTKRKYDIITAEPPPPRANGVVNLYTQEYFQLVYDCLRDGGIVTYWLPVYQLSPEESKSVLRGFCNVFEDSSLWTGAGHEWMMVGIKNPRGLVSKEKFSRQWQNPAIGPEMQAVGLKSPEQFGSLFIADGKRLNEWIGNAQPLVDNYPRRLASNYRIPAVDEYNVFMASAPSMENFAISMGIGQIWPRTLRKKALRHFKAREMVDQLWARKFNMLQLHKTIHDPLLAGYVLWALHSDEFAQRIIDEHSPIGGKNSPKLSFHLAARAVRDKNYQLAEKNLKAASDNIPNRFQVVLKELYGDRIYLAFLSGDKAGSKAIADEYIKRWQEKREKRKVQTDGWWKWMCENVK